jgi:hypothetical protein
MLFQVLFWVAGEARVGITFRSQLFTLTSGIQSINKFVMKIFKNPLKLAKLSAIRPVFTLKTFYSAAISLLLMVPLQRRGWR